VVTAVDPNGVAADHGFQVGDVILDVGGKSVANAGGRSQATRRRPQGGQARGVVSGEVGRGHAFVALPLGNA
jgi:serine protease Do